MATAMVFAGGHLLNSLHFLLIQHAWCAEHQSFAHIDDGYAPETRAMPAGETAAFLATEAQEADQLHANCHTDILFREPATLERPPTTSSSSGVESGRPARAGTCPFARSSTFRLAPKQSPPA